MPCLPPIPQLSPHLPRQFTAVPSCGSPAQVMTLMFPSGTSFLLLPKDSCGSPASACTCHAALGGRGLWDLVHLSGWWG
jgi:hypothetical protein